MERLKWRSKPEMLIGVRYFTTGQVILAKFGKQRFRESLTGKAGHRKYEVPNEYENETIEVSVRM